MTFKELEKRIDAHNTQNNVRSQYQDKNPLICVVVFKESNWEQPFSLESRSYKFRSDEKYFLPAMGGSSWYGSSLDGNDKGVRLDWYDWEIDYCYIVGE